MASVRVNDIAFPVMWKALFLLDITLELHPSDNKIEIDVTNLWPQVLCLFFPRCIDGKKPQASIKHFSKYTSKKITFF